jgi:hypothetical protein
MKCAMEEQEREKKSETDCRVQENMEGCSTKDGGHESRAMSGVEKSCQLSDGTLQEGLSDEPEMLMEVRCSRSVCKEHVQKK